jgi:uncharacterized protein (TIGR02391 family)
MILTDKEMDQVRRGLEAHAGFDEELLRRCGHLIHLGAFDEGVRSAFVLLEERLRKAVGEEQMTGTQLANFAFSPGKGPLAKQLGDTLSEQEGLRELYSGAFKLFRNPTAHGVVEYSAAEGKAIIGLVDLLLRLLKRVGELPPAGLLPENVETAIDNLEGAIGPGAARRLHGFLGRCVSDLRLRPEPAASQSIPFRRHALYKPSWWDEPKAHPVAIFYLSVYETRRVIQFPVNQSHTSVVGFNTDRLSDELAELGFYPHGTNMDPNVDLGMHNDQEFLDALFAIVSRVAGEFEDTLSLGGQAG